MAAQNTGGGVPVPVHFFDQGSYTPLFSTADGPVQAAFGFVGGQGAYAVWQNGDALGAADIGVSVKTLELAAKTGSPVVTFYNSKGSLLQEGLSSLAATASLSAAVSKLSGVVPQIAVVTGVCGASNAMAAASADLIILCREAEFFLTPPFLSAAKGDKLPGAGGAEAAIAAGIAAVVADDEEIAAQNAAKLVTLLPANNLASPSAFSFTPPIGVLDKSQYTANVAVAAIVDEESAFELFEGFGKGCTVSLATISGAVCGVVSTEGEAVPLDRDDVAKIARFVRFCDAFSLPVVTVVNSAGFEQSASEDVAGNLREAARLASTYADATTAKLSVITGKAVGTLYTALASADLTVALEGSVIAPAEPSAVVSVLYHEEIENSGNSIETETATRANTWAREAAGADATQKAGLANFTADVGSLRAT
ncbi:propionyl-CoA carboxylase, partial [Ruminococcaceae bacterium OttesenSCG-928-I18]|nr:propionyl-CoA carboxylase [Ruminococcaceae bacterium OttesenSCG-928-I18]